MPCSLITPRHFEVLRIRARLIVHVDPPLEVGHALVLEDASPNPNDIRLRVLDCDDRDGSTVDADIESGTFLGIHKVALIHADGIVLVDVEEPAMAAANGGGPPPEAMPDEAAPPPMDDGGGGPMFGADGPGAGAPPPAPAAPAPAPAPAPTPGDAAPAAPPIGYGLLDVPQVAVVDVPFVVKVGLSEAFVEGIADKELRRPEGLPPEFKLQVQLQTDIEALAVLQGSSWTVDLNVTKDDRYPTAEVRFVAPKEAVRRDAALQATFSIEGQQLGIMSRGIGIVAAEGEPAPAAKALIAGDLPLSPGTQAPDLTILITEDPNRGPGFLWWTLTVAPDLGVELPDAVELRSDLGEAAGDFARRIMEEIPRTAARQVHRKVLGIGQRIAKKIPREVIDTYRRVEDALAAKDRAPTVLIVTQEAYVPWELAVVESPRRGDRSQILGARAAVGRWILPDQQGGSPRLPPPAAVEVRSIAVVSGDYRREGWANLPEALKEADELAKEFKAKRVEAATGPVLALLEGDPRAQALHFAIHGKFSPESIEQGMILVDGQIDSDTVIGSVLHGTPFVFLNACQLGAADELLGDYAGMAQSFLASGASAVIAPLWNVRDTIARKISLEFYRTVYGSAQAGEQITAGEALRRVRAQFNPRSQNATYVAYQLYGDPNLQLTH